MSDAPRDATSGDVVERDYAVCAMGEDRPGIVARVTSALLAVDASIDDSSMTILGGQFAMLLHVRGRCRFEALEASLGAAASELSLALHVREAPPHHAAPDLPIWVIAAYGPDRTGLVASLAAALAQLEVNITDFGSRRSDGGLFAMWFNVELPVTLDPDQVARHLESAAAELDLTLSIHPLEAEAL